MTLNDSGLAKADGANSGAAATFGTKLGKIIRLVRLIRLLRIMKALTNTGKSVKKKPSNSLRTFAKGKNSQPTYKSGGDDMSGFEVVRRRLSSLADSKRRLS